MVRSAPNSSMIFTHFPPKLLFIMTPYHFWFPDNVLSAAISILYARDLSWADYVMLNQCRAYISFAPNFGTHNHPTPTLYHHHHPITPFKTPPCISYRQSVGLDLHLVYFSLLLYWSHFTFILLSFLSILLLLFTSSFENIS